MAAKITTVNTPTALKLALDRGAEHIEITQHLDLTTLPSSVGSPNNDPDLFRPLPNTRTIRGACGPSTPIPAWVARASSIAPLEGSQCALQAHYQVFYYGSASSVSTLWVDSLSVRLIATQGVTNTALVLWSPPPGSRLYMTNSALIANQDYNKRGITVKVSPAYFESTTFAGTSTSAIFVSGTTAAVSKCRFIQNRADADGDGIIKIQDGSNVTLTQSTWQSNTGYFYHTGGPTARLFSDVKDNSLVACQNCQGQALPLSSPIAPRGVISGSDPALAELIAAVKGGQRVPGSDVSVEGSKFPITAVAAAGAAALLLLLLSVLLCVFRKRIFPNRCGRKPDNGVQDGLEGLEAAELESPEKREKRRAQKRLLYDKMRAANREKRQAAFVKLHPSQLTPEIVTTVSGQSNGSEKMTEVTVAGAQALAYEDSLAKSVPKAAESSKVSPPNLASTPASGELVGPATHSSSSSGMDFCLAPPIAVSRDRGGTVPGEEEKDDQGAQDKSTPDGKKALPAPQLTPQQQMQQQQMLMQSLGAGSSAMGGMMGMMGGNSLMTQSMLYGSMGSMFSPSFFPSAMSTMGADGSIIVPRAAKDKLSKALEAMATAYPPVMFADRFFHTYRDFQRESKAVQHPRLRHILPTVYLANENLDENAPGGILQAPNGFKFPSFLVMERGCSLAQWQQQQPLAFGAAISMLYSVSVLLQTMHHIGRTHRDIQPENILLTIQTQAWKLSDFGMAGAIGRRKKISQHCTLRYACPEAVLAFEDERQLAIHASQDIWSLGVIAYSVLTQSEVFGETDSLDRISKHAHGKLLYPWEDGPKQAAPWRECPAKSLFEGCLQRDPTKRPSAVRLVRSINDFVSVNARKSFMV